jgi:uncharacterized membrane protein
MSLAGSVKLILGLLLLNVVQLAVPTPTTARTSTVELTNKTTPVGEVAIVKPTLLIAQQSRTQRIRFARGASSAVVEDAVVRGTRDIYLLSARAGQKMTVSITSVEKNAVFDIIAPNQKMIKQEATNWSAKLPTNGEYRIVVGGTRGNATYKLRVEIK